MTKTKRPVARRKRGKESPALAARADGLRPDSKMAQMIDMALRPQGATEAEICEKLGWKKCRVTLKRTADKVGAKLIREPGPTGEAIYKATFPPKGKKAA